MYLLGKSSSLVCHLFAQNLKQRKLHHDPRRTAPPAREVGQPNPNVSRAEPPLALIETEPQWI